MRQVIAIIDGAAISSIGNEAAHQHSFCKQISDGLGANAFYQLGPSVVSFGDYTDNVLGKAVIAAHWLDAEHGKSASGQPVELYLAGFSQGGSAAVMAAEFLERKKIPVQGIFLFDAIARHPYLGGEVIPANVGFAYHAVRSQDPAFVAKYDKGIFSKNPTRPRFGTTARTHKGNVQYKEQIFLGSHGAIGGTGSADVPEDGPCQQQVADWMSAWLQKNLLNVTLRSFQP